MSSTRLVPLEPERVWRTYLGGRELDRWSGVEPAVDGQTPEDWIASTTPAVNPVPRPDGEGLTRARVGKDRVRLQEVLADDPDAMLGPAHAKRFGPNLGFLAKLLDASIRLHVQAHPTAAYAQQYLGKPHGKAEGYVILATRPEVAEPYVYLGFQRPPDPDDYRRAIVEQDLGAILAPFDRVPVRPGDALVVPGGLPHAIGEGVLMLEVMEPSDLVVRLEFERGGYALPEAARFMGRGVGLAIDLMDFRAFSVEEARRRFFCEPRVLHQHDGTARLEGLIDDRHTPCFGVRRWHAEHAATLRVDRPAVALIERGHGRIGVHGYDEGYRSGDRFFVPGSAEELRIDPREPSAVLLIDPPLLG
ncbi:MAG: type I phosphomannose isomerase catalytic subunit [Planctomycetota bacterium]